MFSKKSDKYLKYRNVNRHRTLLKKSKNFYKNFENDAAKNFKNQAVNEIAIKRQNEDESMFGESLCIISARIRNNIRSTIRF